MENEPTNSRDTVVSITEDLQEILINADAESSPYDTDEAIAEMEAHKYDFFRQEKKIAFPLEEQIDASEITFAENICAPEFKESFNSDRFAVTEMTCTDKAQGLDSVKFAKNVSLLSDHVDLCEDNTQTKETNITTGDWVSPLDLFYNNIQMIPSNTSSESDSDTFPSQVPSPCSILPEEMDIMSPTMISSVQGECTVFEILLPENNITEINYIIRQDKTTIDPCMASPDTAGATYPHEGQTSGAQDLGLNTDEQTSETLFIDEILHRINTIRPLNTSAECNRSYSNNDSSNSSAEVNSQQNVPLWSLNNNVCYRSGVVDNGHLTEYLSMNSNSLSSESSETEDDFRDYMTFPANSIQTSDFSRNELSFWDKSIEGEYVKVDTPTISNLSEGIVDNEEFRETVSLSDRYISEIGMTCSESKEIEIGNRGMPSESLEDLAARKSSRSDEMLNIIEELRRMSTNDGFNSDDYRSQTEEMSDNLPHDNVTTRAKYTTSNLCTEIKDISNMQESSDMDEIPIETDISTDLCGNMFLPISDIVPLSKSSSNEINIYLTTDDNNGKDLDYESDIGSQCRCNSQKPLLDASKEDEGVSSKDEYAYKGAVKENEIKNTKVPDRGIFKTVKEKSQHSFPKRVSFSTDSSDKNDLDILPENVDDRMDSGACAKRMAFNLDLQISDARCRYGRQNSDGIMNQQRSSDRFRRTLSLPSNNEFYFSYKDTYSENSDTVLLDATTLDEMGSENELKQSSRADNFSSIDNNDESLNGATNFAFLLDSPTVKYSHELGNDNDASYDEKNGIFMPRSDQNNKQELELNKKGSTQRPIRQHSATDQKDIALKNQHKKFRGWHSLEESASETSPLTGFITHNKKQNSDQITLKVQENRRNIHEASLPSPPAPRGYTDDDVGNEDTLSLEFFVPGKKKCIRLHRRTFIHFVLKYVIFFFTFLFWVASLSGIGFGTWMLTSNTVIIDDVSDVFLDPYVLLCVVSGIIFLVSFFGCVGALRENICLLRLFHISLTGVLVLEVLLSSLVFLFYTMPEFRLAVKVGPEEVLKKAVKEYFDNKALGNWIDMVQKEFQCCGVSMSNHGFLDWQENPYYNCSASNPSVYRCSVPMSCCIFMPGDYINYMCGAGIVKKEESDIIHIINTKGCMKSFGEWLGKNDAVIGYVALGVIIPQILGVIAARFFIKNLISRRTTWLQLNDPVQIVTPL